MRKAIQRRAVKGPELEMQQKMRKAVSEIFIKAKEVQRMNKIPKEKAVEATMRAFVRRGPAEAGMVKFISRNIGDEKIRQIAKKAYEEECGVF